MILVIGGAFQGKTDFVKNVLNIEEENICNHFEKMVEVWVAEKKDIANEVEKLLTDCPQVIIADEIGMGIVPMDQSNREVREQTGRALCKLAAAATSVYRVTAGIGQKIK